MTRADTVRLIAIVACACHHREPPPAVDLMTDAGLRPCLAKLRAAVGVADPQATRLEITAASVELDARSGSDRDDVFGYACRRGEVGPPVLERRAVVQAATFPLSAIAFDRLFAKIAQTVHGRIVRVAITQEPPALIVMRVDADGSAPLELDAHGDPLVRKPPAPWPPPEQAFTRAELGSAELPETWSRIDDASVPGDPTAFGPIAQLAWARGIAAAWRSDAFLYQVTITNTRATGTVDLSTGGWAQYWFQSPRDGRATSLLVDAPDKHARARISPVDAPPELAIGAVACGLRAMVEVATHGSGWQVPSPIDLVIDARKRLVWRWWEPSAVLQHGSKPLVSIDAATCKRVD